MAGRRRIGPVLCLVYVYAFLYTLWFMDDLLRPSNERFHLLAKDALLVAHDSVHQAMLSFLEAHEGTDEPPRTSFERNAMYTKIARLQSSLDALHGQSPHRNIAPEVLPSPRSAKWRHTADMQHVDICGSLAGKRITMIGGEHIYHLHVLLLRHRERAEKKPFPCPYHEFCTHHHICLADQRLQDAPLPRYIKTPTMQELINSESAVVNYIVSDTLFSTQNESSWEYTLPFVDPMTGVRLRETYWLHAARKARVVILGRGPLSTPGQTYTGNWSFLRHMPDYIDHSHAAIPSEYDHRNNASGMLPRSLEILNAAVHLTVSRFLPDLFQLLQSIRREVRPSKRKRLIWPSSWYRLPGRGTARTALLRSHVRSKVQDMIQRTLFRNHRPHFPMEDIPTLQLLALINADATNTTLFEDPWTLLYNAQGEYIV